MSGRSASSTQPYLRVPPFPGSQSRVLARAGALDVLGDAELDAAIAALAAARVGGDYWAAQPPLPQAPYTLVKVGNQQQRAGIVAWLAGKGRVLCWVPRSTPGSDAAIVSGPCDPWHLVSGASLVIADMGDDLCLVAAIAGVPLRLADEDATLVGPVEARGLLRHALGAHPYSSPFTGEAIDLLSAIEVCAYWRRLIDSNRPVRAAIGFAAWKQQTVAPLLWSGSGKIPFVARPRGVARGEQVAAWKSRVPPATLAALEGEGAHLVEVEDGFIRSVGLGADCVPPLSIVVDRLGAYFDPGQPSELEQLLENGGFSKELLDRARRLRRFIVDSGVSKYGVAAKGVRPRAGQQRQLLVVGQVEDDRSVLCGGGAVRTNLDLLCRARGEAHDAFILYKPHPDVEAGHRAGAISERAAAQYADEVVRDQSISMLIDSVAEVHVNTSLAGFEALLRGRPVTTHGTPFYAGWGLTRDLGNIPARRTARRTLDEMVAAVLLLYPRYLDPESGLPCPPEILIHRLAQGARPRAGALVPLRRLQGAMKRRLASLRPWAR